MAAALYLLVAGAFFALVTDRMLIVGPLRAAFAPDPKVRDPFDLGYGGDPAGALGLSFDTVTIAGDRGGLPAWWVHAATPANPQVAALYVHGIAGRRENGFRQLAALHDAGIAVLLTSYRNDPGAPAATNGRYNFGLEEWRDVDAAVGWLRARGYTRIILVAESMGGAIAGQFLRHSTQRSLVTALALDSPALDFHAVIAGLAQRRHLPASNAIASVAVGLYALARDVPMQQADVIADIARFKGPIFIAHGTGDPVVPVTISDAMLAQRQGVTTYVRTRAAHLESWHEDPARYRGALARFAGAVAH